jgi:hypothetical protein
MSTNDPQSPLHDRLHSLKRGAAGVSGSSPQSAIPVRGSKQPKQGFQFDLDEEPVPVVPGEDKEVAMSASLEEPAKIDSRPSLIEKVTKAVPQVTQRVKYDADPAKTTRVTKKKKPKPSKQSGAAHRLQEEIWGDPDDE